MNTPKPAQNVVVLVSPPAAVDILRKIFASLPTNFPAAIIILLHTSQERQRPVADNLNTSSAVMVVGGCDGMMLEEGKAHVLTTEQNLIVGGDKSLVPAFGRDADSDAYLLRNDQELPEGAPERILDSVALRYGKCAVAVALTLLDKREASGFRKIREMGGQTIALDESDFLWTSPPEPRVVAAEADEVLPAAQIGKRMLEMLTAAGPANV